jgi:hypothetical protein
MQPLAYPLDTVRSVMNLFLLFRGGIGLAVRAVRFTLELALVWWHR